MEKPSSEPRSKQLKILPPLDILDAKLELDPGTGILRWRVHRGGPRKADRVAGSKDRYGYLRVRFSGEEYRAHRIVWKMHHREEPPEFIDHRNTIKTDNRPENLRPSTTVENLANRAISKLNSSGIKGVHWHKERKRWRASVKSDGKLWRKTFLTFEEAVAAVRAKRESVHGEFANHG